MSALCLGYEIVCPDGKRRGFPYHNQGDADCDAEVLSRKPALCQAKDATQGSCPGGTHTVHLVEFTHSTHSDKGNA